MIIYGQGAIRCHPYVLKEMQAAAEHDLKAFDAAFTGHIAFIASNKARAFWMGLTGAALVLAPRGGPSARYYRQITRLSSAFAYLSDVAMLTLGASLKRREKLSARLGDMLSGLYIGSAALKHIEDQGAQDGDLPLLQWAVESALYDVQQAMHGFLNNLPSRILGRALRLVVLPWGLTLKPPADQTGTRVARALMTPGGARDRLTRGMYVSDQPGDALGILPLALTAVLQTEALEQKLRKLARSGKLAGLTQRLALAEALRQEWITPKEFDALTRARKLKRDVIMVDDFGIKLDKHDENLLDRQIL